MTCKCNLDNKMPIKNSHKNVKPLSDGITRKNILPMLHQYKLFFFFFFNEASLPFPYKSFYT